MNIKERICIVTTCRAPKWQVLSFVNYHLNIGVEHLFLFFDKEDDSIFRQIQGNKKVTCFLCTRKKFEKIEDLQRRNADRALKIAKKNNFDWIIHLDVDELVYITKKEDSLISLLSRISKKVDYIRLPTIEASPEKANSKNIFLEVNLFKNNFWKLSKKFFRGHICGKSIVRVNSPIQSMGIHVPIAKKRLKRRFILKDARLMHYNRCNLKTWKESLVLKMSKNCKVHEGGKKYEKMIREFEEIYSKRDWKKLKRLYKKQFFLNQKTKKIFLAFGILSKIKLNRKLFKKMKKSKIV